MFRLTRIIVIAIAAAAFVPVAHAAAADAAPADAAPCGWVVSTDDLGVPWYAPGGTCQQAPAPAPQRTSAVDATGITNSPYSGWIVVTDDLGIQWLVPVAGATPGTVNSPSADAPRAVTAKHKAQRKPSAAKQRGFWGMITDNSPSQNRVAPRKVAATRMLASTLRAFPS